MWKLYHKLSKIRGMPTQTFRVWEESWTTWELIEESENQWIGELRGFVKSTEKAGCWGAKERKVWKRNIRFEI